MALTLLRFLDLKAKKHEKDQLLKEMNENLEKNEAKLKSLQKENEDLVSRLTKLVEVSSKRRAI